jgi:hypothetical protein
MTAWTSDELTRIATAEELQIQPRRPDGSLRTPTPIWVVREGEDLYVRSYRGSQGRWYRAVQAAHEGRIGAGGVTKDVSFTAAGDDQELGERIDAAYRAKYQRYGSSYVTPMIAAAARATTLRLLPR